ncbi:MAG TPA: HAD-IA family hydrolase [Alphaproteobacteria bacterium]|nr:HAD-IA family hydrolase [Alphaproteobacteria bacterium]HNS44059.1 HAD-IA family hydrolase [Alphaproteobacteria bacterium]
MKHILCDVDGVVVNGFHADPARRVSWMDSLQEDLGICPDALVREFFLKDFSEIILGKADLIEVLGVVLPRLSFQGDPHEFVAYWLQKDSNLNHGFLDWVNEQKANSSVCFHLATNQEHRRADHLWNGLGLKNTFDKMFYAADIGYKKPDIEFFQYVVDSLQTAPSDMVLIDDHPENVDVARSLGMGGIVFNDMSDIVNYEFLISEG